MSLSVQKIFRKFWKFGDLKKEFMYMVLERFREEQPLNYEILIQVKYLDIPVEIVAEEFGLTKSGVNNRIYKAKRWLKEEFRKVYE